MNDKKVEIKNIYLVDETDGTFSELFLLGEDLNNFPHPGYYCSSDKKTNNSKEEKDV